MKPYECPACAAGTVSMRGGPGRTMPYKQIPALELADDFELPTCNNCGEQFLDAATTQRLDRDLAILHGGAGHISPGS